ncbi:hypothetical protein T492DRAFT_896412, partial [Pavlovales sp. CCMP2436]
GLDDGSKAPYNALATEDKRRFEAEMKEHKAGGGGGGGGGGDGGKTFNTPGPKSPSKKPATTSQRSPNAACVIRRLQPAPSAEPDEPEEELLVPKRTCWIEPVKFAVGDSVVWSPRGLATLCAEESHTMDLQSSGLLEEATRLSRRTEPEIFARVLRVENPAARSCVHTVVLHDADDAGKEPYAMPYIIFSACACAQHIVPKACFDESRGKWHEGDQIAMPFTLSGTALRADGAMLCELWEGRIYDVDSSYSIFESLNCMWYEQSAKTGTWFKTSIQLDTSVSPHEVKPSALHAHWCSKHGALPAGRRVRYGPAPNLAATIMDNLDIAPKDDSPDEYMRASLLRLSTLESSEPFLCPVPLSEAEYHALVSDPICLREIEAKFKAGNYSDALTDFTRDVDTLINNAFVANGEDTLVFHQARELSKEWTRAQEARAESAHA